MERRVKQDYVVSQPTNQPPIIFCLTGSIFDSIFTYILVLF